MRGWFKSRKNGENPPGLGIISYASSSSSGSDDEDIVPQNTVENVYNMTPEQNNADNGFLKTPLLNKSPKSPEISEQTPLLSQSNSSIEAPNLHHSYNDPRSPLFPDTGVFARVPAAPSSPLLSAARPQNSTYYKDAEISVAGESIILLKNAVPVILAYVLQASIQAISVLVVGRLSPAALSVSAFCYMFATCTALMVALGGTTALDTLASSSFTGSKNKTDLGILLQRAIVVLGALYVPLATLWWFTGPFFELLGQEDYIVRDGPMFLRWLIPGGLGYVYFECLKKYLQAQGIMKAGTYVVMITTPLNIFLQYLFIYTFDFGVNGAAMATSITYWLSFFLLCLYSKYIEGYESWGGWTTACLKNTTTFLRLAILGTVMVGTEYWAFEIVAIIAGRLGQIPLAAQAVVMTTDGVLSTIPFGIGIAASVRVGNLLGAGDARGASRAANVAAGLALGMGVIVLIVLLAVKDFYANLFNDDEEVVKLTAEVMPWVALFQIADGLNGSCGGSLRGMGRQHVGASVNIVTYYFVALPVGIWLAYDGWGLVGLWIGQCLALYGIGICEWALVYFSDWDVQVTNVLDRLDDADRTEIGEARQ
ncbi:hypothetical protein TWF594_003235 [Orbilia oligospora]|uniref:Uncharacterized protein n=1 Tax=Orbilia oligospora TaxID=2813651 RepID=A0A7C8K1N4_ORBOL|nr:hypothetical protein TWF706_004023 [Orbilia oligospora]KAF3121338.1 hypothetical protein TWF594_003235 [Orbilia oligospora]KAF3145602.1 hypothetical protein TWF703_006743 [Orbilia oligospora]